MTITDQQLADAIRERWPSAKRVFNLIDEPTDRGIAKLLSDNPAPIQLEVGKTYQHAETGNLGVYVGPNPDGPNGHYLKMTTGAYVGKVIYWSGHNITEVTT